MSPRHEWAKWDGEDFPAKAWNSYVYFYPGIIDVETPDTINDLISQVIDSGQSETTLDARERIDRAVILHGQYFSRGDVFVFSNPADKERDTSRDGTWVEVDND